MNVSLVLFAYFTLFVFGLIDNSRGSTYPEILQFFNLSKSSGSLVFSLSSGCAFLLTLSSNLVFRKFGINSSVKFSILLMLFSTFFYGYFGSIENSYYSFLLGSVMLGCAVGILSVGINIILARNSTENNKQRLFSGLHSMYGLASFGSPLLLSFAIDHGLSWQNFYYLLGGFPLLLFLFSIGIKKDTLLVEKQKTEKLDKSITIPMGILFSFYVCSEIILSTRLVIYLTEYQGFTQGQSTQALSCFFLLLLVGRLSFAFIKTKINPVLLLKVSSISTIFIIILGINLNPCLLYTSPSPRDKRQSRMPSSA